MMGLRGTRYEGSEEKYKLKSVIFFNLHPIFFG
jgi:hypothetical protein